MAIDSFFLSFSDEFQGSHSDTKGQFFIFSNQKSLLSLMKSESFPSFLALFYLNKCFFCSVLTGSLEGDDTAVWECNLCNSTSFLNI